MPSQPRSPHLLPPPHNAGARPGSAGFTYIGLLILLAIIALVAGASVQLGSLLQRRAAEEELLAIGKEFRNALQSYADATPAGQRRYPLNLNQLLKDPRNPSVRRHLRKLYADPLTGKEEWGIVEPEDGHGVLAVYSLSPERPIKIGRFEAIWQGFEDSDSYQRWRFGINLNPLAPVPNKPNTSDANAANGATKDGEKKGADKAPGTNNEYRAPMTQEMRDQINQQDGVRPYEQSSSN